MNPFFRKLFVSLAIATAIIVLVFIYPRSGYGEGLAFFQGGSSKEGDHMRVLDPVEHLSEIRELLLSRGFIQVPTERVNLPKVPVLAAGTPGYLEAAFTKQDILGCILDAKVYSTEQHDTSIVGIWSVYRNGTVFDSWYFHREQDILFKRTMELRRELFNKTFRTGSSS